MGMRPDCYECAAGQEPIWFPLAKLLSWPTRRRGISGTRNVFDLKTIQIAFDYSDDANGMVVAAAAGLSDEQLDRPIEMGRGNLRRTLVHLLAGEQVWLQRWRGPSDTPWPDENVKSTVAEIAERLRATSVTRAAFFDTIQPGDLIDPKRYLDSIAGYFTATLAQMILQGFIHSIHHRAQAVNMLRRLGARPPEVDYMYSVRVTAEEGVA